MNEMQIFTYQGTPCRTVERDDGTWWVLKDVCTALSINDHVTVSKRLEADEKGVGQIHTPGGTQQMTIINESGLYNVILRSDKPEAKDFKRWVTHEVLPSIRRHGIYATAPTVEAMLSDPDTAIRLLTTLKEERTRRQALEAQAKADAPKVLFHDAVALADDTILIRDLAKLLKQNGVPNMGGTRLYTWLRENGYLCKEGASYNLPTQRSMELGLFRIRESSRIQNGEVVVDKTPKVTGKGQAYFIKKFLSQKEAAT